jgi:hypothetical protein
MNWNPIEGNWLRVKGRVIRQRHQVSQAGVMPLLVAPEAPVLIQPCIIWRMSVFRRDVVWQLS